jgi:hypothetical protein
LATRARRIVLISAVLAIGTAAAVFLPLLWRKPAPWPGTLALGEAARLRQLPPGFVLQPCEPHDALWEGGSRTRAAFTAAQPLPPRAEASVHPSWGDSPWKLQLYDREGASFVGVLRFTDEAWQGLNAETPAGTTERPLEAQLLEFPVSADTARQLESEWHRSIGASVAHDSWGVDGTTYFFRSAGQCARTWSPPGGSRNHQLIQLLHDAREAPDEAKLREALARIPPPSPVVPWPQVPED